MTRPWIGCDFDNCDRPHRARGFCNGHLEQQRRGKPMTPLRTLPKYAWTYVVYWPDAQGPGLGVLKVGRSWSPARIREMQASGGHVIMNEGDTDGTWERNALRLLRIAFDPAFHHPSEASGLLWRGRGWTECFAVDREDITFAWDLCLDAFAAGSEYGINPPSAYRYRRRPHRARRGQIKQMEIEHHESPASEVAAEAGADCVGSGVPRLRDGSGGCAADRGRSVAPYGRSRAPRAASAATGGGAVFRRLAVGEQPGGSGRPCRDACPGARGVRLPLDVRRGGAGVVEPAQAVAGAGGCTRPATGPDRPDPRDSAVRFHSSRERERGSAREGARACAGARERTGSAVGRVSNSASGGQAQGGPSGTACPAHRLQRSPQRFAHGILRTMRHGQGVSQVVVREAAVRAATSRRRVLAWGGACR